MPYIPNQVKILDKMAKAVKKVKPKRPEQYDNKLAVSGSFLDIMNAAAKNANDKSAKKEDKK